jgi:UDP-N-acetylglucosamine 4,6-dehydratase/5-epimerase
MTNNDFSHSTLLITGGTGSLGRAFVKHYLSKFKRIIIYSRGELKQFEMSREYPDTTNNIQYIIGDVRDKSRMQQSLTGVDYIIHAAALKQVHACESHPIEALNTNVVGTRNLIDAAISRGVRHVVFLSTDKACLPINTYGVTKAMAERLVISANTRSDRTSFKVVRYGNVMGSRGSVIPYFISRRDNGLPIPITHPDMTRFWLKVEEAAAFIFSHLNEPGGCIYIPKLPSMKVTDLAEAIAPGHSREVIGIRPGEKLHESLISKLENVTADMDRQYIITPYSNLPTNDEEVNQQLRGKSIDYRSDTTDWHLTVEGIRTILQSGGLI